MSGAALEIELPLELLMPALTNKPRNQCASCLQKALLNPKLCAKIEEYKRKREPNKIKALLAKQFKKQEGEANWIGRTRQP